MSSQHLELVGWHSCVIKRLLEHIGRLIEKEEKLYLPTKRENPFLQTKRLDPHFKYSRQLDIIASSDKTELLNLCLCKELYLLDILDVDCSIIFWTSWLMTRGIMLYIMSSL